MTEPQRIEPSLEEWIALNRADEVNTTDTGNAKRFVRLFRNLVRYVPENELWLVWNGRHWEPDVTDQTFALTAGVIRDIRREALELPDEPPEGGGMSQRARMLAHALRTEAEGPRRKILNVAPEDPRIVARVDDLDVDPDSLCCPNGTVSLVDGTLRPSKPEDMATACVRVPYEPDVRSRELDRYLATFVPEETDQRVLFALLGTALRGGNHCRMLPLFLGGTTSGKSQLTAAVARLLRGYATAVNVSVFRGNLDDKPRPDLVRAMRTRLAYATEASKVWELHADQVKRLTGGDTILYRNLYAQAVEATPNFTPLIVTNDMPRVKGADEAFKRRMIVFRFEHTLSSKDEDPAVKERFVRDPKVLQAILARCVEGAMSPIFRNGIKWDLLPEKFVAATMDSFSELDHVGEFIRWAVEVGRLEVVDAVTVPASHCVKAAELHEVYVAWVKQHGDRSDKDGQLSMRDFGSALRTRGWEARIASGTRWLGWKLSGAVPWL